MQEAILLHALVFIDVLNNFLAFADIFRNTFDKVLKIRSCYETEDQPYKSLEFNWLSSKHDSLETAHH